MATKRIIAYFMHETEREYARPFMQNAEVTDSFWIGDIDDNFIGQMRDAGLIVEEVSSVPGLRSAETFEAVHGTPKTKLLSARGIVPTFGAAASIPAAQTSDASIYLVQLRGPLIEGWRTKLQSMGVEFIERFPNRV